MLGPVTGSLPTTQTSAVSSATNLRAQLARYEAELASWENCPSCKTTEGKAKIAEIAGKIGDIKQRMEAAELSKQDAGRVRPNQNEAPNSLNDSATTVDSASPANGVGSLMNVYA
ncbi:MAG: hypothetical protein KKE51_14175 [Gammaproteobacteria bacterium]|nr:hypothetical protein [Gammaproteobacteria bacterium]MBU1601855.1 hypothetical protein [Gammaproteobacteria bacterium]MBU2432227.1 hypothetical protein [Gammaproteobacteria bacterium]MBU2450380.1 hypothetical protein [Gammaproteobacteria bacterium]